MGYNNLRFNGLYYYFAGYSAGFSTSEQSASFTYGSPPVNKANTFAMMYMFNKPNNNY